MESQIQSQREKTVHKVSHNSSVCVCVCIILDEIIVDLFELHAIESER